MAVGLSTPEKLLPVKGLSLATAAAGLRYAERDDMLLISLAEGSNTVAVFTQNKFCAAPVHVAKEHLQSGSIRALLINAGNANAGTGSLGMQNAYDSCLETANKLGISANQVLPFSTGVIGEQLQMAEFASGISLLTKQLDSNSKEQSETNWLSAANAIMTTDTVAKGASEQIELDGVPVTITGIAKGSGMICPNMATLLSFVGTDANIDNSVLQAMLERGVEASFNRITVDSDTSTNDALTLTATGQSGAVLISDLNSESASIFYAALERVLIQLATSVVRDAEGATKFVKIDVINGRSESDCVAIAYSIAHSPLVKTALFASDPNWGRLLMAVGKADVSKLDIQKLQLSINDLVLIKDGEPAAEYSESAGKTVFEESEIVIRIDLCDGHHNSCVWTSDLSHDYVSINADYRS